MVSDQFGMGMHDTPGRGSHALLLLAWGGLQTIPDNCCATGTEFQGIAPHQVVGDQFGMGMDDTHMKIRGAPVLDEPALSPHQKMIADKLAVSELMSMAVVALPPIVKVPWF